MVFKTYLISLFLFLVATSSFSQSVDSTAFGWLSIDTKVDTFHVVVDRDFSNSYYIKGDSLQIQTGRHELIIIHPDYKDYHTAINIRTGSNKLFYDNFKRIEEDSTLSSYKRITVGLDYNVEITTDRNSVIVINDSTYGTGYVKADIGPYDHRIKILHPTAGTRSKKIYINPSGQQVIKLFVKPKKAQAILLGLIPAASQWYKSQKIKAIGIASVSITATLLTISNFKKYTKISKEYAVMIKTYRSITDEQEALEYGNLVERKFDKVSEAAKIRDVSLAISIGLYAANVVDAVFSKPESGYRMSLTPTNINVQGLRNAGVKLRVNF